MESMEKSLDGHHWPPRIVMADGSDEAVVLAISLRTSYLSEINK